MADNHHTRISFRVKPNERSHIFVAAKQAGLSVGSHIRKELLKDPETKTVYRRTQLRRLFTSLIGHMGRVGNNMNQIAWKQNSGQVLTPLDRQLHEEGVTALKEMRVVVIDHFLKNGPC